MAIKVLGGKDMEIDEDGFIQEPDKWDEAVAESLAEEECEIHPMTEDAWKLVNFIRQYYIDYETAPAIRMLCKKCDLKLNYIYEMFPKGPAAGACKVAGLPKPTGCV